MTQKDLTLTEQIVRLNEQAETREEAMRLTRQALKLWEGEKMRVLQAQVSVPKGIPEQRIKYKLSDHITKALSEDEQELMETKEIEDTYLDGEEEYHARVLVVSQLPSQG